MSQGLQWLANDYPNIPNSKPEAHRHADTDNEAPTVDSTLYVLYLDAETELSIIIIITTKRNVNKSM